MCDAASFQLDRATRRVLVVCIDHHLGNTVIMLPVLAALAEFFEHGVDVLVDERYHSLVEAMPRGKGINRLRLYPAQRDGYFRKNKAIVPVVRSWMSVARGRYRAVIDLTGGKRAAAVTWASRARHRVGFADARGAWGYNRKIERPRQTPDGPHAFSQYAAMLQVIGAVPGALPPLVSLDASDLPNAAGGLADRLGVASQITGTPSDGPWVVLHPFAGKTWRLWPVANFVEVGRRLIDEFGVRVAVVGTDGDESSGRSLVREMGRPEAACFLNLSLGSLLVFFRQASLLVSNESGPTHLAAATDLPIVTIFGPTVEAVWRPIRAGKLTVLRGSACDRRCRGASTCAAGRECLTSLSPETVLAAAKSALRAQIQS